MVVGVVCRYVVPALVLSVLAAEGPVLVRVEGLLVVPVFPAGSVALDVVCSRLVTVTVMLLVPSLLSSWLGLEVTVV